MALTLNYKVEGFSLDWDIKMGEPEIITSDQTVTFKWENGATAVVVPGKGIKSLEFPKTKQGRILIHRCKDEGLDDDHLLVGLAYAETSVISEQALYV